MDVLHPPEAWKELGRTLERRRGQLGYGFRQRDEFLRDRGSSLSSRTLARLERGERAGYPASTIGAVEALYGWLPGSIERVLAGGEPLTAEGQNAVTGESNPYRSDPDLAHVWAESEGLPDAQRHQIVRLAARIRDRGSNNGHAERREA